MYSKTSALATARVGSGNAPPVFQGMEEAWHGGMVVTVTLSAHAAEQALLLKERLVIQRRVLATPIGMKNQPGWGAAPEQGHAPSLDPG